MGFKRLIILALRMITNNTLDVINWESPNFIHLACTVHILSRP